MRKICLLLCALALAAPLHSTVSFAQDDVGDFEDELELNEDAVEDELEAQEEGQTAENSADEDDLEKELEGEEEPAQKPEKEEPAQIVEEKVPEPEPEQQAETEPVPEPTPEPEPESVPELAEPEPTPEPTPEPSREEPQQIGANPDAGPDLEYEARLYDIFVNYLSSKTPEDEWRNLVGQRQAEAYQIQNGDNLWDISRTLFGDGNYWPKIWSLNSSIQNPHVIEPNNTIRFLLGDESGPPAFTVAENEQESPEPPPAVEVEQANSDDPEIPPPSRAYRPVMKKLPPSLPQWQDPVSIDHGFDRSGISYGRRKIADLKDIIPLAAYISESQPEALGHVEEVETGFNMAAALQYIYVRMKPGQGEVGDTFLSVVNRGQIKASRKIVPQKYLGFGIEVLGEIQLLERVKSEKSDKEGDMFRALVTKTVSPVQTGSPLISGKIENVSLTERGSKSQIVAQIIGGQFSDERKLYGPQSFAFLNRGTRDGLAEGLILPIRANRRARDGDSKVLANVRSIGWLKVVKVTENFATAIVLRSWQEIVTGDYTGAGEPGSLANEVINGEPDTSADSAASVVEEFGSDDTEQSESDGFEDEIFEEESATE